MSSFLQQEERRGFSGGLILWTWQSRAKGGQGEYEKEKKGKERKGKEGKGRAGKKRKGEGCAQCQQVTLAFFAC
eukprot:1148953-Pelagomonas_calceolata.AAC.4